MPLNSELDQATPSKPDSLRSQLADVSILEATELAVDLSSNPTSSDEHNAIASSLDSLNLGKPVTSHGDLAASGAAAAPTASSASLAPPALPAAGNWRYLPPRIEEPDPLFSASAFRNGSGGPEEGGDNSAGWLRAVFDNGVWTSGLNFHFSRDVPVTTYSASWDVNEPRFGNPVGVQPYAEFSTIIQSNTILDFMGSGWGFDGQTPLICIFSEQRRFLKWYSGDNWDLIRTQNLNSKLDLLNGAVPTNYYQPVSGIIHEGLHVMMTTRWDKGTNKVDGVAFFYTQDYGTSWTEVPNVAPETVPGISGPPEAFGIDRGGRWAFGNAFPNGSSDSVTDVWFPWGDYLRKTGSPKGGQIGLFRATRVFPGSAWTVQPNRVIWNRWEPQDSGGLHAHGATIHPLQGVVLSWWGDVGYRNEIVSHKFEDLNNYATSEITTHRQAFGGYDATGSQYLYSNQAAGFAPGPEYGTALAVADENPERLVVVSVNASGDRVSLQPLMASATNETAGAGFSNRTSLWIHYVRNRGYVMREIGTVKIGTDRRVMVSEDGWTWTKLQYADGGTPVIYANSIATLDDSSSKINRRPWRGVQEMRPLVINPGGLNLHGPGLPQRTAPMSTNTVREVYVDAFGTYRYASDHTAVDFQPIDLPPVPADTPLVEITVGANRSAGTRWLMSPDQTTDLSQKHYWLGWVYPLEQRGLKPTYRIGGAGSGNLTTERGPEVTANDQWFPTYHFGGTSLSSSVRSYMHLNQMNPGSNRWLLASQSLTEGAYPPYPLSPGQSGSHEIAYLDGYRTRLNWTTFLSMQVPQVGFDAWGNNGTNEITLATAWTNPTTYAEIVYGQTSRFLHVRIVKDGNLMGSLSLTSVWLSKEDRLDLVLTSNGSKTEVTVAVPQLGASPVAYSRTINIPTAAPKQIRFSNHDQSQVAPLHWLAAHVLPNKHLSLNERIELLKSDWLWTI